MELNGLKNGTNPNREVMKSLETSAKNLKTLSPVFPDRLMTFYSNSLNFLLFFVNLLENSFSSKNFTVLLNLV